MKKYILTLVLIFGSLPVFAQTIDLSSPEVRTDVTKYKITDLVFHQNTRQAIVTIGKGYMDAGSFISVEDFDVIFQGADYTKFISDIGLKTSLIKSAVKTKIGK